MNPALTIPLLLLLTSPTFSQKVEKYYDYMWRETEPKHARYYSIGEHTDTGWHRKDYFMPGLTLRMEGYYEDSTCRIGSGAFVYSYPNKIIESQGKLVHGKKQGLWLSYYPDGFLRDSIVYDSDVPMGTCLGWHHNGYISDSGVYRPDGSGVRVQWFDNGAPSYAGLYSNFKRQGKWKYFHKNGQLSATEIYDQGRMIEKHYFDENGNPAPDTVTADRKAEFPGGQKAWLKYLEKHIYFPVHYKIVNSDAITVMITATIDENGKVEDAYVSIPFYPEFDNIALNAVRRSPKWIPAKDHNRNIKSQIRQPVTFSQPE